MSIWTIAKARYDQIEANVPKWIFLVSYMTVSKKTCTVGIDFSSLVRYFYTDINTEEKLTVYWMCGSD